MEEVDIVIRRGEKESALLMDEILALYESGARVLDAGCGPGSFDYKRYPDLRIEAIDENIPLNLRNFPENAHFVQGRVGNLPYEAHTFDVVLCNWVLEHVRFPEVCLQEIKRVLRPNGHLYVSIPNASGLEDRLYRLFLRGGGHLQRYSFESFLKMAYTLGFQMVSFCQWPAGYTWLRGPRAARARDLWLRVIKLIKSAFGLDLLVHSNWLLLFTNKESIGFRRVSHVCKKCGGGVYIGPREASAVARAGEWACPGCGARNLYI